MKMRRIAPMRIAKIGYVVMSLIFCVLGTGLILHADIGTKMLGTLLGIAMIVFGIVKIIGYFSKDLFRLAFQYDLEFGSVLAVLGIEIGGISNLVDTVFFAQSESLGAAHQATCHRQGCNKSDDFLFRR